MVKRRIDLTGQTFGHLFVLKRVRSDKRYKSFYLMRCDADNCGKVIEARGDLLTAKKDPKTHCGCLTGQLISDALKGKKHRKSRPVKDLTGQRFGHLLVVNRAKNNEHDKVCWNCICDCGKKIVVQGSRLTYKKRPMTHCGCLTSQHRKDALKGNNATHGLSKTPKYHAERDHRRRIKIRNINPSSNLSYAETFKIARPKLDYCVYCGSTEKLTIDHIIPINKGGNQDFKNLIRACKSCNASKNDSFFIDWYIKSKRVTRSLTEIIVDMDFDSIFHLQHYQDSMCPEYAEHDIPTKVTKLIRAKQKSIRLLNRYYKSLDNYPTH